MLLPDTSEFIAVPPWLAAHIRRIVVKIVRGKCNLADLSEGDRQALMKMGELLGEEASKWTERPE